MKKILCAFLFFLAGVAVLHARAVIVEGRVKDGKGLTIRLMKYADQVSYLRQTLDAQVIAENDSFSLAAELDSVEYCWIDIGFQQGDLILQPGQQYLVDIGMGEETLASSYYDRIGLQIRILRDDADRLNMSVRDFNLLYNDFLLDYAEQGRAGNAKTAYENFNRAIELRFQMTTHPYFLSYIRYKMASMQLYLRIAGREKAGMDYIAGNPVLYNQVEYMDFFHLYFEKYFITGGKYFSFNKTYNLVNGEFSAGQILDSLAADPVLDQLPARELLLLDGLKELYNMSGFNRKRVFHLISELADMGSTPETRAIATNLQVRLKRLQPGSPAPSFSLAGITVADTFNLEDFSGKLLYLAFFDSQNPASQSELGMIAEVYDRYRGRVAFVAVSVDQSRQDLEEYLRRAGIPWLVLDYGGDIMLLENYDATSFPHFVLIGDKGQILLCPAPSPSENLGKLLGTF